MRFRKRLLLLAALGAIFYYVLRRDGHAAPEAGDDPSWKDRYVNHTCALGMYVYSIGDDLATCLVRTVHAACSHQTTSILYSESNGADFDIDTADGRRLFNLDRLPMNR